MIKRGDLVMVVRQRFCCKEHTKYGHIGTVLQVRRMITTCPHCLISVGETDYALLDNSDGAGVAISRLRKIDPPSEGETREAYMNLKQPRKVTV